MQAVNGLNFGPGTAHFWKSDMHQIDIESIVLRKQMQETAKTPLRVTRLSDLDVKQQLLMMDLAFVQYKEEPFTRLEMLECHIRLAESVN